MKHWLTCLFIIITIFCYGQEKALKLIDKKKYDKAIDYITKGLVDEPNSVILIFAKSKLYFSQGYSGFNTDSAYLYIKKTESNYALMDQKSKQKISETINGDSIHTAKMQICLLAFNSSLKMNSVEEYEKFMSYYLDADTLLRRAVILRDKRAFEQAMVSNSIESYQHFADKYPTSSEFQDALERRNAIAYKDALQTNTVEGYDDFVKKYPNAKQTSEVAKRRNKLAFNQANKLNTIASYDEFLSKYPEADEFSDAVKKRDEIAFHYADSVNLTQVYGEFIKKYPNSAFLEQVENRYENMFFEENTIQGNTSSYIKFIASYGNLKQAVRFAQDSLFYYSYLNQDLWGLQYYEDKCQTCIKSDSLFQKYFEIYTSDGDNSSIEAFENNYPDKIDNAIIEKSKEIAIESNNLFLAYYQALSKNQSISSLTKTFDAFIKMAAPRHVAFVALQTILKPDIIAKNYAVALKIMKYYDVYFGRIDAEFNSLKELLSNKIDPSIQIKSFGANINSNGDEYVPIMSADNKTLYFCGRKRTDNLGGEDIYVCSLTGNSRPKLLPDINTAYGNEAPEAISADGTQLLVFRNGDIFKSNKTLTGWSDLEAIDKVDANETTNDDYNDDVGADNHSDNGINTSNWEGDAMISSDGKALIFSSDRPGGMGFYHQKDHYYCGSTAGNIDIYVSLKNQDGTWGKPINLGSTINTPYCERTPFLHPDMKTLYFSSDGHGGLGDLDVYKSTRLYDTSWVYWSTPVNMGKEINTAEADWGYNISTDGERALFSRESSKGDQDIFYLNLPPHLRPNYVATISGTLTDRNNKPVSAKMKWEDLETGKNVGESKSDPVDGSFFIVLPLGKIYGYYVDKKEFFPLSNNIDLRNEKKAIEVQKNINLVTFKEMIDNGTAVQINNLFFLIDKYDLLPASIPELRRVAMIIKSRNLKVEISGYCDSTGNMELNQKLSEQRAAAVKDFLVKQGCNSEMLTTIGYGDTKPIADNKTEEGRSLNRRVELRIISVQ